LVTFFFPLRFPRAIGRPLHIRRTRETQSARDRDRDQERSRGQGERSNPLAHPSSLASFQ
jgi:hypothetical protein